MMAERLSQSSPSSLTTFARQVAWEAYLYGLGVDIVNQDHITGLAYFGMAMDPLGDEAKWNSLSAIDCARQADQAYRDRDPKPLGKGTIGVERGSEPPQTWIFRTRDGGRGILQITEIQRNPKEVKLRYKLVQDARQPAKTPGNQTP
jgi:hypothetical protein